MTRSDLTETAAAVTVAAGVFVEFGAGWALIVTGLAFLAGAQLRGIAAALAARHTGAVEDLP